jgi:hypothetical protein
MTALVLREEQGIWDSDPKAVQTNSSKDVEYMVYLLKYLEETHCIDTSLVFATGMGTGGGMLHLLACNETMSRQFAAFAVVGGAFYTSESTNSVWHSCNIGRRPIPFLEIHGTKDEKWPYKPAESVSETGLQTVSPAKWLKAWAERNNCGIKDDIPYTASFSKATILTHLTGGTLSEGVEYGGGAVRVAYSCPPSHIQNIADDDDFRNLWNLDLLQFSLKDVGYGWPRTSLKQEKQVVVNGVRVHPPGDAQFDSTRTMFEWFVSHPLPAKQQIRKSIDLLEREKAEKEQEKAQEEKEAASKAKDEL